LNTASLKIYRCKNHKQYRYNHNGVWVEANYAVLLYGNKWLSAEFVDEDCDDCKEAKKQNKP